VSTKLSVSTNKVNIVAHHPPLTPPPQEKFPKEINPASALHTTKVENGELP
jgi:hypothetical protein